MLSIAYPTAYRFGGSAWIIAAALLAGVTALSSMRLVAAPGFEFYLGPLFYLLAYRWFGVRAALVTAVATMAPSIFWWGHPMSMLLAVAHVLVIDRFARPNSTLAPITLLFQITCGTTVALGLFALHFDMTIDVVVIAVIRKVLCEVLLAACADLIALVFVVDPARRAIRLATQAGLQQSIEVLVSMALAGMATLFLLGELHHVRDRLALNDREVRLAVDTLTDHRQIASGQLYTLRAPGLDTKLPVMASQPDIVAQAVKRLGCKRTDSGQSGPNDRDTFVYWIEMCYVLPLDDGRVIVLAPQPLVHDLFRGVIKDTTPLVLFLGITQICLIVFGAAVRQSTKVWEEALAGFGRQQQMAVRHTAFREIDELLNAYTEANNAFVSAEHERAKLSYAVDELRSVISLKLLNDIQFDHGQQKLRYVASGAGTTGRNGSLAVYPADAAQFARAEGRDNVALEFRRASGSDNKWYLLMAKDYDPVTGRWSSGCLIHLRTARAYESQMRHNARLMELGGMASALSHEMRQPLATISLAAENGKLLLDNSDANPSTIVKKLDRIIEQVERANTIVQRTSGYARTERGERDATDLRQTIADVTRFLRPVMNDKGIEMEIEMPEDVPILQLPTVGVEQILVNALQNAADSIETRQADGADVAGRVVIRMVMDDGAVTMTIRDNGAGLSDSIRQQAFKAFCTSKPLGKGTGLGLFVCRQIMDEIGGSITLANNMDAPGATLTLCFPKQEGN